MTTMKAGVALGTVHCGLAFSRRADDVAGVLDGLHRGMRLALFGIWVADGLAAFTRRRLVSKATLAREVEELRREVARLRARVAEQDDLRRELDELKDAVHELRGLAADEASIYLRGYVEGQAGT
jgi:cell division protein FtsB